MTDTTQTSGSDSLDDGARRRRLRFRAWHRGIKENDLIIGTFVDTYINDLSADDIVALEALMEENDQDVYRWICQTKPVPEAHMTPVLRRLQAHIVGTRERMGG